MSDHVYANPRSLGSSALSRRTERHRIYYDGAPGIMIFQGEALSASRLGANLQLRTRLFMIREAQSASICDLQQTSLHIECKACRN